MAKHESEAGALHPSRGLAIGGLVTFFVLLGVLACADGLFGEASYRPLLFQCGLLAVATVYLGALVFRVEGSRWVFAVPIVLAMAAAAIMLLPFAAFSFSWLPFVALALCAAFAYVFTFRRLGNTIENIVTILLSLGFGKGKEPDPIKDVQSGLLAVWVTAGGLYVIGRVLALPYIGALAEHSLFRGFLDIRALILVTLVVPAAMRAAIQVRVSPGDLLSRTPQRATAPNSAWERVLLGLVWPLQRLAHLIYRVVRYIGLVVLMWTRAFAQQLRDMLSDVEVYKGAGKVLLTFAVCAIIVLSSSSIASALTDYLRQEPPWSGGSLSALWSLAWVVGGLSELLLLSLLVTASLQEAMDERNVVAAAEFIGWGIVSAACASLVLWLAQHYSPLRIIGFSLPGVVAALTGTIVLTYLVKLWRVPKDRVVRRVRPPP
jgi:hypothetical protein